MWEELVKEGENVKKYIIVFDDGHGMESEGKRTPFLEAFGREFHENEFNSTVIKMIAEMLSEYEEFEPLEVAPIDKDNSLSERVTLANEKGATLYLSVYANTYDGTFEGKNPEGISVFCYPGSVKGTKMVNILLKYLVQGTK